MPVILVALGILGSLCLSAPPPPAAGDGTWEFIVEPVFPRGRFGHGAIYDPVGHRQIIFSGSTGSGEPRESGEFLADVWELSLDPPRVWNPIRTAGTAPEPRHRFVAVHDSKRHRMIVIGGWDGARVLNDVHALSLSGVPNWEQIRPQGDPPPARFGHTGIYDPIRDRIVLFGGSDGWNFLGDVWELSLGTPVAWRQITPGGIATGGRYGSSAVYDDEMDRMLVYAGLRGTYFHDPDQQMMDDVLALSLGSGETWSQVPATGEAPVARYFHSAIFDPQANRMIVHGGDGRTDRYLETETWGLSLGGDASWTKLAGPIPWSDMAAPYHASLLLDPVGSQLVYFRGVAHTFSLTDASGWIRESGAPRLGRSTPGIHDPRRNRLVLPYANVSWSLPLEGTPAWEALESPFPGFPGYPRRPSIVLDEFRDRLLVVNQGGYEEPWTFSLSDYSWTVNTHPENLPVPYAYYGHRAVVDPETSTMWMFAGIPNQLWSARLSSRIWERHIPVVPPPPERMDFSMVFDSDRRKVVLFGGRTPQTVYKDLWEVSVDGETRWQQLSYTGRPPPSAGEAFYDSLRKRMVVVVGNDVWTLQLGSAPQWGELNIGGAPPTPRTDYSSAYDSIGDRLILFGGETDGKPRQDIWAIRFHTGGNPAPPPSDPIYLAGATPNPSATGLNIAFSLATADRAIVELFDVRGRRLNAVDVSALGPGSHSVDLSQGIILQSGTYLVRLTQGGASRNRKVTYVR